MLDFAAVLLSNLLQVYFLFLGFFYLFLAVAAVFLRKNPGPSAVSNKFAVMIVACNEEKVVGLSVQSLVKMDYPAELYDVFVIADNCSDGTARVAEENGARVLEHREKGLFQTKGRALKWGAKKLLEDGAWDAICYFDADTLAHPGFLKAANGHMSAGEKFIQGRQLAKNRDGWLERILAVGHLLTNTFFQKPKYALGLSATLHGKGMIVARELAEKYEWDETCLTEDIEMQMKLVRDGVRITWAENAVIYDEEPANVLQYMRRAVRWTRGSLDVARKHLWSLAKRAVTQVDIKALEGAIYSFNVYRFSLALLALFFAYYTRRDFNIIILIYKALPGSELALKLLNFIPLVLYPLAVLVKENFDFKMIAAYFLQPVLGILQLPVFVAGVFQDRKNWNKTFHESDVSIEDIIGGPAAGETRG